MARLNAKTLLKIMDSEGLGTAQVARMLERPMRTVQSWVTPDGERRNVPYGEIERLCFILDPTGERGGLVGWIVVAATGRRESGGTGA